MRILSDQGAEFQSDPFRELCRHMDISEVRTSPYHPACNGMVERLHRTTNAMLAKVVRADQRNWCQLLPSVMTAYRATPHEATGYSPNV
jgi:transposase InsO family protein